MKYLIIFLMFLSSCSEIKKLYKYPQAYSVPVCALMQWDGKYPVNTFQREIPLNKVIKTSEGMPFKYVIHPDKEDHILIVTNLNDNEGKHIITNAE